MVLVIIIVVAWVVILGPNLLKRRSRTLGGISSISHFHRQLRVLEHSAPEPLVTPAFRLRAVDGSGPTDDPVGGRPVVAPKLTVVGADRLPRPALAFLGDDPVGAESGAADRPGAADWPTAANPLRATDLLDPADRSAPAFESTTRPPDAHTRAAARKRRRDTLGVLMLTIVLTLLIGCIPGAGAAWLVTLVAGAALAAYVALLVRMRRMAEERERKLVHYLRPAASEGADARYGVPDPPVRIGGRYAHPSAQAAVAH